ncbi:MAG: lactam utilization protein LamB [Flavobacteriales bacterium]|nr:MAG: lactam utilization protein LamB [Flavobacteriales bacterium]
MYSIDLNCDLGEGTGNDLFVMPLISSCSIACGGHFGNKRTIKEAIELAEKYNVKTGAHPSYLDIKFFGRKSLDISLKELQNSIRFQLDLFFNISANSTHIKPHGALYNDLFHDLEKAEAVVEVFKEYGNLYVFCQPFSKLSTVLSSKKIKQIHEGFGDRVYNSDYTLSSRQNPSSVHESKKKILDQVAYLVKESSVITKDNKNIELKVQTICLHGDNKNVINIISYLIKELKQLSINVKSY